MSTSHEAASTSPVEERREAGPLPRKRGELGYVPPEDGGADTRPNSANREPDNPLPARHPADRDHQQPASESPNRTQQSGTQSAAAAVQNTGSATKGSIFDRLSWQGVQFSSLVRIFLLLAFLGGTGGAWALTINRFGNDTEVQNDETSQQAPFGEDNQLRIPTAFSSLVFVHVAFTIIILFELLFLERAIYHARAERYLFKHGMPRNPTSLATMGLAPWNRPPLPTYAAALAESGVGTGDAEDNMIAIPPPPAYGNTRGSVLLLSSFLPNSLARTFTRDRDQAARNPEREMEEGRRSRPISYGASEELDDARRAMQLEHALQKLEDRPGDPSNTR